MFGLKIAAEQATLCRAFLHSTPNHSDG
jgi:hypothetical protein